MLGFLSPMLMSVLTTYFLQIMFVLLIHDNLFRNLIFLVVTFSFRGCLPLKLFGGHKRDSLFLTA